MVKLRITPNKKGKEKYILIISQMKKKNATHNEELLCTRSCIEGLKKPFLEEVCGLHINRETDITRFERKRVIYLSLMMWSPQTTFNKYLMPVSTVFI
jgi:hypothetical protein